MKKIKISLCAFFCTFLISCGGGGGSGSTSAPPPAPTYAVSVTVNGLVTGNLTVSNGTDTITVVPGVPTYRTDANSAVTEVNPAIATFPSALAKNSTYAVTLLNSPADETCALTSTQSGTVTGPVSIVVTCAFAPTSTTYPAFVPPYPLVQAQTSTPPGVPKIIASPRIIPVFYSDISSTVQSATVRYLQQLIASDEWAVVGQYGVGAASIGNPVLLTQASPTQTTQAGISGFINANAASWTALDGNELFIIYYPSTTTISDLGANTGAYHTGTWVAGQINPAVPYAVIPGFSSTPIAFPYVDYQYHEIIEAVTDPYPVYGYGLLNHDALAWTQLLGKNEIGNTEIGDMCFSFGNFSDSQVNFSLQAIWSDANVLAGKAPCVGPEIPIAQFGAYPVLPNTYVYTANNYTDVNATPDVNASVIIAAGTSVTIPVYVFSYGSLPGLITVSAKQTNLATDNSNQLAFAWDKTTALNGDVIHLTITAPATAFSPSSPYALFEVMANVTYQGLKYSSPFPGVVTNN